MPPENEELTDEQQTALDKAEEAAMLAGYDDEPGDAPAAAAEQGSEEPPSQAAQPNEPPPGEEGITSPEQPPAVDLPKLLAEIEGLRAFKDQVEARMGQVFGKFGEVQRTIQQLQQARSSGGLKLEGLKRTAEEFPEMAKFLQEDLAEAFAGFTGSPATAPTSEEFGALLAPRLEEALSEVDKRVERRLLKREHADWEQVVASKDFADWKSGVLPPQEAAALDDSWDADFIGERLKAFKTWKAAKDARLQDRRKVLEDAIVPNPNRRETNRTEASEEEALLDGFYGR